MVIVHPWVPQSHCRVHLLAPHQSIPLCTHSLSGTVHLAPHMVRSDWYCPLSPEKLDTNYREILLEIVNTFHCDSLHVIIRYIFTSIACYKGTVVFSN